MPMLFLFTYLFSSIYSFSFSTSSGSIQNLTAYQGKKMLLVNIATGSARVQQLAQLQALQQRHSGTLIVIAFPSNSFGNEPLLDNQIQQFCVQQYGVTFPIAAKNAVVGSGTQPIYNWLTTQSENGQWNGTVGGDFQKFLIAEDGSFLGVFSPSVDPLSEELLNSINQ